MEKVTVDDVENRPNPLGVHGVRLPVSQALDTEDVALVVYELEPGEQFSGGLHTHHDQEEIFYVLSGTATFEVGTEREEVTVDGGEVIRFPPGEFQSGHNHSDEPVRALVVGAPARATSGTRSSRWRPARTAARRRATPSARPTTRA